MGSTWTRAAFQSVVIRCRTCSDSRQHMVLYLSLDRHTLDPRTSASATDEAQQGQRKNQGCGQRSFFIFRPYKSVVLLVHKHCRAVSMKWMSTVVQTIESAVVFSLSMSLSVLLKQSWLQNKMHTGRSLGKTSYWALKHNTLLFMYVCHQRTVCLLHYDRTYWNSFIQVPKLLPFQ